MTTRKTPPRGEEDAVTRIEAEKYWRRSIREASRIAREFREESVLAHAAVADAEDGPPREAAIARAAEAARKAAAKMEIVVNLKKEAAAAALRRGRARGGQ